MPIVIENATAKCKDCEEELTGSFLITVANFASVTKIGYVKGTLVRQCAEHHDVKREWGRKGLPQHNDFIVFQGTNVIGTMRVATMALENPIVITDTETYKKFAEETRLLQEAHRRQWRY